MKYPQLIVPKLHGVRLAVINGRPLCKNGVVIMNQSVNDMLGGLPALDGHVTLGDPRQKCHDRVLEFLNTPDAIEPWTFWVYDMWTRNDYSLAARLEMVSNMVAAMPKFIQYAEHQVAADAAERDRAIFKIKEMGYDSIIIRDPFSTERAGEEV